MGDPDIETIYPEFRFLDEEDKRLHSTIRNANSKVFFNPQVKNISKVNKMIDDEIPPPPPPSPEPKQQEEESTRVKNPHPNIAIGFVKPGFKGSRPHHF